MNGRRRIKPGSWAAVPLRNDAGYAVVLVARVGDAGAFLLGYFFGPRRLHVPALRDVLQYRPGDAVLIAMFGLGNAQTHTGLSWANILPGTPRSGLFPPLVG